MKKPIKNTFTLVGINNTLSVLRSKRYTITQLDLLKDGRASKENELMKILNNTQIDKNIYDKKVFHSKYANTKSQGIAITFSGDVTKKDIPDFSDRKNFCLLVLDQIEDPQNFGQIIRTAECAGIDGIIFPKHHSAPMTQSVLQVSQGAFVNIPIYEVTNLRNEFKRFKEQGFWIIGLENSIDAKPWFENDYTGLTIIVLGSEGKGIREKVLQSCDFKSTIPMQGITNSLNVSAAVSAIVFERLRQININL
jgi:23S rRNA (guanosine2251-2'-O)-methyltransferase|tara:strand:+ start:87 stop:839 length:753 start_codon:yes stop_codon:yes gene_type:complete